MFKVGDRVKTTKSCSSCIPGEIYTVFKYGGLLYINRKGKIEKDRKPACCCEDNWILQPAIPQNLEEAVQLAVQMIMVRRENVPKDV